MVVKRVPFTIRLLYDSPEYVQPVILGVDAGSKVIGLSATTPKEELYASEVELRNDIVELLSTRREFRQARRNQKTRYRAPRFNNRVHSKSKGWLAPYIENKIQTHIRVVQTVCDIQPISRIIVETAAFDIQKIRTPGISSAEYQQGDQMGFWNVREYVLWRDGHRCQGRKCCQGKILNVHHIETRKEGGNSPADLVTLCEDCHHDYHSHKIDLHFQRGSHSGTRRSWALCAGRSTTG